MVSHCVSMVAMQEPECSPASRTQTAASLQGPECPCLVPSRGPPSACPIMYFPVGRGGGPRVKLGAPAMLTMAKSKRARLSLTPAYHRGEGVLGGL